MKVLTEEASNRRALVDSLKRRLAVASREKSQQEAACLGLRQDLEKKVHLLTSHLLTSHLFTPAHLTPAHLTPVHT